MTAVSTNIYQNIAERTGGDIYIGVVGPVRTGKSTFVKRLMETLVIPNIDNIYQKERAKDELPQSGSGRTIMTSEPKFVPEDAIKISPDGTAELSVRLIDSVGYMIPGAIGAEEEGRPRMVTTPWFEEEIPMTEAAQIGTKKIMEEHCSVGIVITTDGTIHDIPREDYLEAERLAIQDMISANKPFIVLINSSDPDSHKTRAIEAELNDAYNIQCMRVNCLTMDEQEIKNVLAALLYEFPTGEVCFQIPDWLCALPYEHKLKEELFEKMLKCSEGMGTLRETEQCLLKTLKCDSVESTEVSTINLGNGVIFCKITLFSKLFYNILSEYSGINIQNDSDLITLLSELSRVKKAYDKVDTALQQVHATGYGIVMPTAEEMQLESPEIIRKGSNFGVRLKASAPSIHMMRADIQTEISPMVGDEKQSEELLRYLLQEYEDDTKRLWESNIFGKSVYELVSEGLNSKLKRMPEEAQYKLQSTLSRIINEDSTGLLCIILA